MSPEEWLPLPKRPLVVAQVSRGMPRYHGIPLLDAITTELGRRGIGVINIGEDVVPRTWSDQRRLLGAALIYLDTTFDSPMPRGRTEAMHSGCCLLTTPRHDADSFVENGVSGFLLGDDPQDWCDLVEDLLGPRFDEAVRIGRRARDVATRAFHIDGYLAALWEIVAARAARRRDLCE